MLEKIWRKGNPHALLVEMYFGATTKDTSTEISPKIKNRTTIQFSNSTPQYLHEENKNTNYKRIYTLMFTKVLF